MPTVIKWVLAIVIFLVLVAVGLSAALDWLASQADDEGTEF
jgi:hypothetical protein